MFIVVTKPSYKRVIFASRLSFTTHVTCEFKHTNTLLLPFSPFLLPFSFPHSHLPYPSPHQKKMNVRCL